MKHKHNLSFSGWAVVCLLLPAMPGAAKADDKDKQPATGGSVTGGSVTGGSVTGGSVTGGSVTGGSVSGGTVTPGTVTPGTVTAVANGREIRVMATGAVSVNVKGSTAHVQLDKHVLEVEKERMVLDGTPQGILPAATKKVEIGVQDEMLTVKADGKEVLRAKLDKIDEVKDQ